MSVFCVVLGSHIVHGVTSENIVQYWQLPANVKHAIRVDTQKRSK